jgi:3'-phosphoadenosine 5'-phosphosulfate sulfotransferase (PAPS reductase)/FAD synthetase
METTESAILVPVEQMKPPMMPACKLDVTGVSVIASNDLLGRPIEIISLGAGVQSSTMALMAARGEITSMPTAAIFADTQAEPASVYRWLDWLEKQLPFPVYRVTKGSLVKHCLSVKFSEKNKKLSFSGIPAFIKQPDGSAGLSPRQCTHDFKIDPCTKAVNAVRRAAEVKNIQAILWIGISIDEIYRAKVHRNSPRIENRFPLFEHGFDRHRCLQWMKRNGFPKPPRSACYFCPYHNDAEWVRLKNDEPEEFQKAIRFEIDFQISVARTPMRGVPYLHRSMKPLSEVDFSTEEERGQTNLFNNECEGMCGL